MRTILQNKEVGLTGEQAENSSKTLHNLARESGELVVGSGYRHPFPEKVEAIQEAIKKRKMYEEKQFNATLAAIHKRINELQEQADYWKQKADDIETDLGGIDAIAKVSGTQRKPYENDEEFKRRVNDDILVLIAAGEIDPNSDIAAYARARDNEYTLRDMADDIENEPDPARQQKMLEELENPVLWHLEEHSKTSPMQNSAIEEISENFGMNDDSEIEEVLVTEAESTTASAGSLFSRMRSDRSTLPGEDIQSDNMPQLQRDFADAHDNVKPDINNSPDISQNNPAISIGMIG